MVTLGKFDGIHRGHQKLISCSFSSEGLTKTVFTFTRPPREVVEQTEKKVLLTSEEKRVRMEALGVELLIEFPFTEAVCRMEPEAFVEQILIDGLHAKKIITGPDFGFGYQRRGNTALLEDTGAEIRLWAGGYKKRTVCRWKCHQQYQSCVRKSRQEEFLRRWTCWDILIRWQE